MYRCCTLVAEEGSTPIGRPCVALARMSRLVAVVAHTHWDREWYAPYERFRARLMGVLDEVVAILEADPSFRRFLLDGQVAMVDDYLEVRPEAAAAIRRLVEPGAWPSARGTS